MAFDYRPDTVSFMGYRGPGFVRRENLFTLTEVDNMTDEEYRFFDALIMMGLRETCLILAMLPKDRMGPNE